MLSIWNRSNPFTPMRFIKEKKISCDRVGKHCTKRRKCLESIVHNGNLNSECDYQQCFGFDNQFKKGP